LPRIARRLFGSPEAHGRAEGAIHGALAVPGPARSLLIHQ
jgi:hypothetical protein